MTWNRKGLSNTVENFVVQSGGSGLPGENWYNANTWDVVNFRIITTAAQTFSSALNIITSGKSLFIDWGDGTVQRYVGTGTYQTLSHAYKSAGTFACKAFGDLYHWTGVQLTDTKMRISFEEVHKTGFTSLVINSATISDGGALNVNTFSARTGITKIQLVDPSMIGSINFLGALPVTYLYFAGNPATTGDLSNFSAKTGMQTFILQGDGFTGDTADLPGGSASTLLNLWLDGDLFTGDLSDLASFNKVTSLRIEGPMFTGNLNVISNLPATATFITVTKFAASYTTATLKAWTNATISVRDLTLSSGEVDQFLIDAAAAGVNGGTLNIAGTNAARTSASDAAVATLTGAGVTVTSN